MTRVAIQIEPQFGFTFDEVVKITQLAEQTGYHALWASDHLQWWDEASAQRNCFEAWTLLTALAPLTSAIRLGSLVTCNSFRYPSMLAKTAASLDAISNGRIDCGIGAGWNDMECRAYGIPFPPIGTRMDQLQEAVAILKQLWTHDRVDFQGEHYALEGAICVPKPIQTPLPLWIGGQGERRLLRLVAEAADGWNMVLGQTVDTVRRKIEVLQRHCDTVGRDVDTIDKSLFVFTFVGDSEQDLRQMQADQTQALGAQSGAALERARQLGLGGSVDQVVETLRQYQALGFDYFVALFPYTHETIQLQRYAEEVWPQLGS